MTIIFTSLTATVSLFKKAFCYAEYIILAILIAFTENFAVNASEPVELIFCYENKEFIPHYMESSTIVPHERPGVVIDILRELDTKVDDVIFTYIRQPWARCLKSLASNKVSAVVGSHSSEREKYGAYPKKGIEIDQRRAFGTISTCLLYQKTEQVTWNEQKLKREKSLTLAVPRGYKIGKKLQNLGFSLYITNSLDHAHKLLFSNRVSASISDCTFKRFPAHIIMDKAPIRKHYGFLVLSKNFYVKNEYLSEKLWDTLQQIDKSKHYQNYLNELM